MSTAGWTEKDLLYCFQTIPGKRVLKYRLSKGLTTSVEKSGQSSFRLWPVVNLPETTRRDFVYCLRRIWMRPSSTSEFRRINSDSCRHPMQQRVAFLRSRTAVLLEQKKTGGSGNGDLQYS